MKIVAIICEYNPFHNGHKYQIDEIRRILGEDTAIIAIMSGNFTQRGECAIMDKSDRAKIAVECGINLCLELPFPYSMASAELFAGAAVHIINSLTVVDYLVFGSESGDLKALDELATLMLSQEFTELLSQEKSNRENKNCGYPELVNLVTDKLIGKSNKVDFTPNNILALEYLKALKRTNSKILPLTIKRIGSGYSSEKIENTPMQSATAIRNAVMNKDISALNYIPKQANEIVLDLISSGDFPADTSKLDTAIIAHFRLNSQSDIAETHDADGGLYNCLRGAALEANDIQSQLRLAESKAYTRARLRRAIMFSFLGVTSSEVKEMPRYTQILALDSVGKAVAKSFKGKATISVLTKPSNVNGLTNEALMQKKRADRADSIYQLTKPCPKDGCYALRMTPYLKK